MIHLYEKVPTFLRRNSKLLNLEIFPLDLDINLGQHHVENLISYKMGYFFIILSAAIATYRAKF